MLVPTKARLIKRKRIVNKNNSVPWREAMFDLIEQHSEGGLILRANRTNQDLSQRELAKLIGISQHHVSEMENGKRPIGKEMAKRFAAFFQVDYRIFL